MKIKEFIGSTVLDKKANVVGKVENIDFDTETGKIETITLTLQTFSQEMNLKSLLKILKLSVLTLS